MARSGPQKIPGANLSLFFGGGRRYTGSDMEVNCAVAHTTEGATLYDYGGGAVAPTVTAVPDFNARRLAWYQHFDIDESARALVNAPGGVQTNTANVFQIELVGTCDPATHADWARRGVEHIYWPDPPDWAVRDLAWLMRWLRDQHGIPLTSGVEWLPYPASYGASRVRMSFAQWTTFTGWCGHQHVPENDHGDPGALPIARLLAAAAGQTPPTTTPAPAPGPTPIPVQEDDMPFSEADIRRFIREEVSDQPTRDAIAFAVDYKLGSRLDAVPGKVWEHQVPVPRLQPDGSVTYAAEQSAYWPLVWGNVWNAQVMAAIAAAALTPAEVQQALADGTLHVSITVAPATAPKAS
jgi:hypothetical protein